MRRESLCESTQVTDFATRSSGWPVVFDKATIRKAQHCVYDKKETVWLHENRSRASLVTCNNRHRV